MHFSIHFLQSQKLYVCVCFYDISGVDFDVQLKTTYKLQICCLKKGHRNQRGGCPDTLDTPVTPPLCSQRRGIPNTHSISLRLELYIYNHRSLISRLSLLRVTVHSNTPPTAYRIAPYCKLHRHPFCCVQAHRQSYQFLSYNRPWYASHVAYVQVSSD